MYLLSLLALLPFTFLVAHPAHVPNPTIANDHLHGIYFTSNTATNQYGKDLIERFKKVSGNLIVMDIQDSAGRLAYASTAPLSKELDNYSNQIADLKTTIKILHDQGFYVAARFVLFKNGFIAQKKPQWALREKESGKIFSSRDGPIWLDPGNLELKGYLIAVAAELALAGVDEVQFDYARFPDGGKGGYIGYTFTGDGLMTRDQAITSFVKEAAAILHFFGTKVSIDVFGITVWDNVSWKIIGQNIHELAKNVDTICPMSYPSHFGPGWGGFKNPADEPYFFIQETTKKFIEQTKDTAVKIRPWLQGFTLGVTKFGPDYIREQIRALREITIDEYTVWNARNSYDATFSALAL